MRFFNLDLIAKGSFQTTPEGQRIFYPNGLAGKGYLIDSETCYQRLFRQQKYWGLAIMASISLLVAFRFFWPVTLGTFIALNLLKQAIVRRTTRHMQISSRPYSIDGFFREGLRLPSMPKPLLICIGSTALLTGLSCLAAMIWYPERWRKLLGWSSLMMLLAYLVLRELRELRSMNENKNTASPVEKPSHTHT